MTAVLGRLGRFVVGLTVVGAVVPAAAVAAPVVAPDPACVAVAHHQDASHTGVGCGLATGQLAARWTTTLEGTATYPLVAANKVFVVSSNTANTALLYALNARTGASVWGPVPIAGFVEGLTFADNRVFVDTFDGDVTAFAAATGRQLWTAQTAYFAGEPVAFDGAVFVQGAGTVFALDAARGARRWSAPLDTGDSAVAVDATGVYVSGECSRFRLDRTTGAVRWRDDDGCSGGLSGTAYLSDGRMFDSSRDRVLNAANGNVLGTFAGSPAFAGGTGYFVSDTTLFAATVVRARPVFSTTLPATAVTSPVVAGGVVWIGLTDGRVVGVDATTGSITRTVPLARTITRDLAIGQGRIVVVAGNSVVGVG